MELVGTAVVPTGPDRETEVTEPGPDGSLAIETLALADGNAAEVVDVADG